MTLQPEEMLEEWDWEKGIPTGKSIPRSIAHQCGIAHEGVHLWIVRSIPIPQLVFQKRASHKDMYPGYLDITVGGHVPYGLDTNKIHKEAYEEIGIIPDDNKLIDLGYFRYEENNATLFHREFQRVYLYMSDEPLTAYSFNDNEVNAVYAIPVDYCKAIFTDDYPMEVEAYNGYQLLTTFVSKNNFHPLLFAPSMSHYMDVLFTAIEQLLQIGTVTIRMS